MRQSSVMTQTRQLLVGVALATILWKPSSAFVTQRTASRGLPTSGFQTSSVLSTATAVNGESSTATTTTNGANSSEESTSSATPDIRLNVYEKARTVTSVCTSGTLCTLAAREGMEGAPFGSFVDYVLDDEGNPVLLMNDMSMHTINIRQTTEASGNPAVVTLFTQRESSRAGEGQDVSRCSLTGILEKIDPNTAADMDQLRMRYSLTHAYADQVMDSPKFAFYRLLPNQIYFVGGFGVLAKWMEPADYAAASPDILAASADEIMDRINSQHDEDLQLTAQHLLDVTTPIESIRMTNVDRLGMDIRVTSQMGSRRNKLQTDEFRVGFRIPVMSVEDAKSEILKVFQEAWEKANDFSWGDDEPGSSVPILKIAADSLE